MYPYLLDHSSSGEDNPIQLLHMDWSRPGPSHCLLSFFKFPLYTSSVLIEGCTYPTHLSKCVAMPPDCG